MPHQQSSIALLALVAAAALTPHAAAQKILSCADVECPIIPAGGRVAKCTVADKTFEMVGISQIDVGDNDNLAGLSWTKAVTAKDKEDNGKKTREFEQLFYLGTPLGFRTDGMRACALFFNKVSDRVKFGNDTTPVEIGQGTCGDAMTSNCVNAILERAKSVDLSGFRDTDDACERLEKEFEDNLDAACQSFATGSKWVDVEAEGSDDDDDDDDAPQPIVGDRNSTSNCWPTSTKSNDLRLVYDRDEDGDFLAGTANKNFFGITPVLTVFFPRNGTNSTSSAITSVEAQLTCVKAIDLNTALRDSLSSGNDESAASGPNAGVLGIWAGLAAVVLAVILG
ncbi:hypothetical protein QBC35DRAFT_394398 [Podospora australis]|uniref:Uncharacterized protein n=1 Tax=Podospora australis TaxID=1536484 RepID=A0AAN6WK90_9PEZI|nr:hypothetical protein QBC35DRAFT_394398 [Podospora australis]